ncbi:MAG: response regulator, partial [Candidatus Thermoplasmatota archaeon]|nr:response regulator [Candidatus Thermoplasmatota archaeon]
MDGEKQTVLIVVGNPMTESSLAGHFDRRGWVPIVCDDGDRAVDEYVEKKPDLVLMALDISGLDGHVAALEIRETDFNARVAFVTTRSGMALAEDAAFSAGATAILTTPITTADLDDAWPSLMGDIPGAPGLADLDELYPEIDEVAPPLPAMPPPPAMPEETVEVAVQKPPKKKRRWLRRLLLMLIVAAVGAGAAHYAGLVDLSDYVEQAMELIP